MAAMFGTATVPVVACPSHGSGKLHWDPNIARAALDKAYNLGDSASDAQFKGGYDFPPVATRTDEGIATALLTAGNLCVIFDMEGTSLNHAVTMTKVGDEVWYLDSNLDPNGSDNDPYTEPKIGQLLPKSQFVGTTAEKAKIKTFIEDKLFKGVPANIHNAYTVKEKAKITGFKHNGDSTAGCKCPQKTDLNPIYVDDDGTKEFYASRAECCTEKCGTNAETCTQDASAYEEYYNLLIDYEYDIAMEEAKELKAERLLNEERRKIERVRNKLQHQQNYYHQNQPQPQPQHQHRAQARVQRKREYY